MTLRLRRSVPGVLAAAALVAAAWSLPSSKARACSYAPPDPTFDGAPVDGATDVPTNVVPVFFYFPNYEEPVEGVPGKFVLETSAGEAVASTARPAAQQWFEIVPSKPLNPNTGYRIRGTWTQRGGGKTFETQLAFTTGAGPRTAPVNVPIAKLQNLDWQPKRVDSCSPQKQLTCIALQQEGEIVEYVFIDSFGQLQEGWKTFTKASFFTTPLTPALPQGTNFLCVRLRTRAIDGTFSTPAMHCGVDGPVFHVPDDRPVKCKSSGLVVEAGAPVRIDPPGAAPPPGGTSGIGAFAGSGAFAGTSAFAGAGTGAFAVAGTGAFAVAGTGPSAAGTGGGAGATSNAAVAGTGDANTAAAGTSRDWQQTLRHPGLDDRVIVPDAGPFAAVPAPPRRADGCGVQQGSASSATGLAIPFAVALGACVMRTRKRARSRVQVS